MEQGGGPRIPEMCSIKFALTLWNSPNGARELQEYLVNLAKTEHSGPEGGWPQNLELGPGIQEICSITTARTLWNKGGVRKSWKPVP